MLDKISEFWDSLDDEKIFSKKALIFGAFSFALLGIVIGVFCSPKGDTTISSMNGNQDYSKHGCDGDCDCDCCNDDDECDDDCCCGK